MGTRRVRRVLFGDVVVLVIGLVLLIASVIMIGGVDWQGVLSWVSRWGLAVALAVLGLTGIVDGVSRLVRPPPQAIRRLPVRPIRAWVIAAIIIVVAAATWGGVTWVLSTVDPADPKVRVDAIKTGLAIGGGTGAAIALLLTARRQWLNERAQVHTEDDATERRVTELYTKAADQLGADKDPVVRLAALYSLERLAQANPEHRQTIVNVICAYLRMPYTPPPSKPAHPSRGLGLRPHRPGHQRTVALGEPRASVDTRKQELQVRLTAQRILADHLRPDLDKRDRPTNSKFWADIDLDLTGATVIDLDFSGGQIGTAQFRGANFAGNSRFVGARFIGDAVFDEARFAGDALFGKAGFGGDAVFIGVAFGGAAVFGEVRFTKDAMFDRARFDETVWFDEARFGSIAVFGEARFGGPVWFNGAWFDDTVWFDEARFNGVTWFDEARFAGNAGFDKAQFGVDVQLRAVRFRVDGRVQVERAWPPGWRERRPTTEQEGRLSDTDGVWGFLERAPADDPE